MDQKRCSHMVCRLAICVLLLVGSAHAADIIEAFTEPYRTAVVVPSQPGLMESVGVKIGQRVTTGQDLGSLDCAVLRVQRKISQTKTDSSSELDAAKAELQVRQSLYERYLALRKDSNEASELEVNRKRADMEIQQAKVRSVEDARTLQQLEVELLDAQIRQRMFFSPIDGIVVDVDVEQGDFVAPAQTQSLMTIVDIDQLRASFHVPSREAITLKADQEIPLELSDSRSVIAGKIEYVSPVTDPRTGTVLVRVIIPNHEHNVRSGVRCRYKVREGQETNSTAVKPSVVSPK